jgi:hypothetical protein
MGGKALWQRSHPAGPERSFLHLQKVAQMRSEIHFPIQRAPVVTAGGVWNTTTYEPWGPERPDIMSDWGIGAEISLSFMPGKGSPKGDKIGLIQSVKALNNGIADPTGHEAVPLNDQGLAIDRDKGESGERTTNPVYGAHNTKTKKATGLTGNVPKSGENKYGIRNRIGANKPATLWDKPSSAVNPGEISKTFETTAVVLEGKQAGNYLGSVSWGYRRSKGAKKPHLDPATLTLASFGNPTEEFLSAAQSWNEAATNKEGENLVKVPIPK